MSAKALASPLAPMLAILSYPTREEARENWDKLSEKERETWRQRDEFEKRLERETLNSPDQLPEIEGGRWEAEPLLWESCQRRRRDRSQERFRSIPIAHSDSI